MSFAWLYLLGVLITIYAADFKCPSAQQWRLRAQSYCGKEEKYTCLYYIDAYEKTYKEQCNGPRRESPGEKTEINNGNFNNVDCSEDRYQPIDILFSTTQGSECLYLKSNCSEEGQVVYSNGSTTEDRTCGCNYEQQYAFVSQNLRHQCFCVPSVEDCTCYKKTCAHGHRLSPDYECVTKNKTGGKYNCKEIVSIEKDEIMNATIRQLMDEKKRKTNKFNIPAIGVTVSIITVSILLLIFMQCRVNIDNILNNYVRKVYILYPLVDTVCFEGDTCILQCEISKLKIHAYWYKDGGFIPESKDIGKTSDDYVHRLTIKNMSSMDAGHYQLGFVENARHHQFGLGDSTTTEASVEIKPVLIHGIESQICIEGDAVNFTCEVSEIEMIVTWYKQDSEIKDFDNVVIKQEGRLHRLSILNTTTSDAGEYKVRVKNVMQRAPLTVKEFFKHRLDNNIILEGLNVMFTCQTEKSGLQPTWYKDGEKIEQSDQIVMCESEGVYKLSIDNVDLGHKGTYLIDIKGHTSEAILDVKEIPLVLKEMSIHDRETFMEAAKAGTAPRYYIRIMIVGENGVGKTCLLRRLLNEGIDDVKSTDGINIEVRKCKIGLEKKDWIFTKDKGKTLTKWTKEDEQFADCGFWDFAGQKEYYATHQTFLSSNAIYILAIDLSKDWVKQNLKNMAESEFLTIGEYLDFWLDNIHLYVSNKDQELTGESKHLNPPVILVGTGTDKINKDSLQKHIKDFEDYFDNLLGDATKRRHLEKIFYISNLTQENSLYVQIRDKIFELAQQMPKWGEPLPLRWILLEKLLLRKEENVVSYDMVRSFAVECALPVDDSNSELDSFLKYEREIGNIIFFDNAKEYIILNPGWLVDAFRCLVAPEEFLDPCIDLTELKRSGKISEEILEALFDKVPELKFEDQKFYLLRIMGNFDILVEKEGHYYMPCLIKASSFENVCTKLGVIENIKCKRTSWLCIDFTFLPPGFFNHILVTYIRRYPLAIESENKLALYRGIGIFDLSEDGLTKIALCISSNTIAMQIWVWEPSTEKNYVELRSDLLNVISTIQRKYRIHAEYTINFKCSKGCYYLSTGKINTTRVFQCQTYFCDEHREPHDSKSIYMPWFSESGKDKDKDEGIEEKRFGGRCTTCNSEPSVYWCFECKTSLCENCNSKHQTSVKHRVQHVQDKYTLDYTFNVNVNEIYDIKIVSDGLLCVADFRGRQLVTIDITSHKQQSIPLPGKPLYITVVDNSTVAVTLVRRIKVVIVDIRHSHIIKHINVKEWCWGIMYSNNQLFVGCTDNTIKVLSMSGEITNTIQLSFIPMHMCCIDDGSIYCTDYYKLYCIDTEGNILFTFTHPDMGTPHSITTDDTGHVLVVCYRSNNILSISPDGKQCQVIVKHIPLNTLYPCICYIPQSKSLVVGRNRTVDVYKLWNVD